MLALAASLVYRIWGQQLMQAAMVPSAKFVPQKALVSHTYASPTMWYARPDIRQNNPALWTPAGVTTDGSGQAAIFFIHPTSSLERSKWNAPLDDKESADRARLIIQGTARALHIAGPIWAPRYRQAHVHRTRAGWGRGG